jgi:endonuclease/exonuclease/phosphatase family metal-dependent hydrolase
VAFKQGKDTSTEQDVAFLIEERPGTLHVRRVEETALNGAFTNSNLFKIPSRHVAIEILHETKTGGLQRLTIINVHLKAGQASSDEGQRARQSRVVNRWAKETMTANGSVIIIGDFNAAKPFHAASGNDAMGIVRGMETAAPDDDLIDLHAELPAADRGTHITDRELDRILVSPNLLDDVGLVFKTVAVRRDLVVRGVPDEDKESIYAVQPLAERDLSDHYPLAARFVFRPEGAPDVLPTPIKKVIAAKASKGAAGTSVVRLGSWNIEHLGSASSRAKPNKNKAQTAEDLAFYIQHARVDVLALQEITADLDGPPGASPDIKSNDTLKKALAILSKTTGASWRHLLFRKEPPEPGNALKPEQQWVGVAWNSARVEPIGSPFRVPVANQTPAGGRLWDRNVYAIKFSAGPGKTDFVVMPVHMKSNRGGSQADRRLAEAKELVRQLPKLHAAFSGEADLLIVGDTNALDGETGLVSEFQQAGFLDLNRNTDTYVEKKVQPFDRFFVPAQQPEFTGAPFHVLHDFLQLEDLTRKQFRARYSDHFMVVTEIRVLDDDD